VSATETEIIEGHELSSAGPSRGPVSSPLCGAALSTRVAVWHTPTDQRLLHCGPKIREAVMLWCGNLETAVGRYGHISLWDTHRVTDMSQLFYNQISFNDDISGWDVSQVTTLSHMLHSAAAFNQPIGTWNTSIVTDTKGLFLFATKFNQPLNGWEVSSVKNMSQMFQCAYAFNQPLSTWNVSSVTNMFAMFSFTRDFNQTLNDWDVSGVTSTTYMFNHKGLQPAAGSVEPCGCRNDHWYV
jgi:surface protein